MTEDCLERLEVAVGIISKKERLIEQQEIIIKTQQQLIEKFNEYIMLLKNRLGDEVFTKTLIEEFYNYE
jgi:hypothetical protein